MKQLIQKIEQWADERNVIEGSSSKKQMLKLMEEFGELCRGIAKNKPDVIKDSVGDCFIVFIILMAQKGHPLSHEDDDWEFANSIEYSRTTNDEEIYEQIIRFNEYVTTFTQEDGWFAFFEIYSPITMLAEMFHFSLRECAQHAYDKIKDRKGRMIDGVFVKEEDLRND